MKKTSDLGLMAMVTLMIGTVCMETDIYVPAFPLMKHFFGVSDHHIQNVISVNFVGICLGSLIFGPICDIFGRYNPLKAGLALFCAASWGCVLTSDFNLFLAWRFFQGIGAAAPMVMCVAMMFDTYDSKRVAQLCGLLNLFVAGTMACSPILGSILILYFTWHINFMVIAVLATLSFFGALFL